MSNLNKRSQYFTICKRQLNLSFSQMSVFSEHSKEFLALKCIKDVYQ